jgi:hypothetical protein
VARTGNQFKAVALAAFLLSLIGAGAGVRRRGLRGGAAALVPPRGVAGGHSSAIADRADRTFLVDAGPALPGCRC